MNLLDLELLARERPETLRRDAEEARLARFASGPRPRTNRPGRRLRLALPRR